VAEGCGVLGEASKGEDCVVGGVEMYLGVSFVCIGKVSSSIIISYFFDSFTLTNYYPNGVDTTLRRGAYFWGHFGAVIIDVEPVSDCGFML